MGDERKRDTLHKKFKNHLATATAHATTPISLKTARELMVLVTEAFEEFKVVQDALEATAVDDAAYKVQEGIGAKIEKAFSMARMEIRQIVEDLSPSASSSSSSGTTTSTARIKLPVISLPEFDGKYSDWMSYRDLFTAAIANNTDLSAAQKLQYLKTSLRGEAANLIKYLPTTDTNYSKAWSILDARYDNKREIVQSQISKLLDYKVLKSECAKDLQALIDFCVECLHSLTTLGCSTYTWDDIIIVIIVKKLDPATRREWAKRLTGNSLPTFNELSSFLESHIRGLQAAGGSSSSQLVERRGEKPVRVHHAGAEGDRCPVCNGSHPLHECKEFLAKSPSGRSDMVKRARLCFNCLRTNHMIKDCPSGRKCKKCGSKHHTLLHEERQQQMKQAENVQTVVGNHVSVGSRGVVMTAVILVADKYGVRQPCRLFIDNGSTAEFISEACTQRLGLTRKVGRVRVRGFGDAKVGSSTGIVQTQLISRTDDQCCVEVELHAMKKLTGTLPTVKCHSGDWKHLQGLRLADPKWYQPGPIDIVVGIKYINKIMLTKRIVGPRDEDPVAWETIFGWIVAGACPVDEGIPITSCHVEVDLIDQQLKKFWEVEEPPRKRILTSEEKIFESHFLQTYQRDGDGRFVVGVPFDEEKKKTLGKSRDIAYKRLLQVEKRLQRQPHLKEQYVAFMKEYAELGHMSLLSASWIGEKIGVTNYLCHHFVTNDSSTTTKLRVVFDGSAPTSTGVSLNDTMLVGASLQDDLYDILLRFRVHPVVLKADMTKMFRQFKLRQEDANFHRILWRESPNLPVHEYQLNTVTYGTACAPNLSTRCVQQLGADCSTEYPAASKVILSDTYVDDILAGSQTPEEAINLFHELNAAVATAGLELRKWTSNSSKVMETIPESMKETSQVLFDDDETVKALGVQWHPSSDIFSFKEINFKHADYLTKRMLLSDMARVFNPLGLISCVTLRGKLLLQELWKLAVDWDGAVSPSIKERWEEYKADALHIPRKICVSGAERQELCGFSDRSELGFGGIIYLRSIFPNGNVEVRFVTSKTRVATVRQVTLPRLELCAAVLVAELVVHVKECLKLEVEVMLWSDSTITLTWIAASPRRWKTYVANRVAAIQELTTVDSWRHVAGVDNPADLASRGCTVVELCQSKFWWEGPAWLSEPLLPDFPKPAASPLELEERKVEVIVNHVEIVEDLHIQHFSSLDKLKRLTAWYFRYLQFRLRKKCPTGPLKASELHVALMFWVYRAQQQHFQKELICMMNSLPIDKKSNLKSLFPFLDRVGIIRVSGRLRNANLPENHAHQIILPGKCHLVKILIVHYHNMCLHGGFQVTWAAIQAEFWIIRGRDKARHMIRSCVRCRRYRAQAAEQLMGDLPSARVTPSRPFSTLEWITPVRSS